jgi:hypothetical protein
MGAMRESLTTTHLIATEPGPHKLVSQSRMSVLFALWAVVMRCLSKL